MTDLRTDIEALVAEWEAAGLAPLYESPVEMAQVLRALLAKHPAPTVDRDEVVEVLTAHQVVSRGMTSGSPDICSCEAEIFPAHGDKEIVLRRHHAFAQHQTDVLLARFDIRRKA